MGSKKRLRRSAASKAIEQEQKKQEERRSAPSEQRDADEPYAVDALTQFEDNQRQNMLKKAGKSENRRIVQQLLPEADDEDYADSDDEEVENATMTAAQRNKLLSDLKNMQKKKVTRARDESDSDDSDDDFLDGLGEGEDGAAPAGKGTSAAQDDNVEDSEDSDDDDDDIIGMGDSDDEEDSDDERKLKKRMEGWTKQDFHVDRQEAKKQSRELAAAKSKAQRLKKKEQHLQAQQAEEEDAIELQKERVSRLRAADFLDDVLGAKGLQAARKNASKEADADMDESEDGSAQQHDEDLSKAERLKIIMKESPELLEIIDDLKRSLAQLRQQVQPLITKAKQGQFATAEGISYLEVKYHLLLSYCIDIVYYLLLKSSGKPVQDHPVVAHLVELRLLIEQIKPIDERMKYQINKLVQLASSATSAADTADRADLSFRPNPAALVGSIAGKKDKKKQAAAEESDDDEMSDEESEDEDEEDAEMDEGSDSGDEAANVYVPPKIIPVEYDEKSDKKLAKKQKEVEKKLARSKMVQALKAEMSDEPEAAASIGTEHLRDASSSKAHRFAKDLEEYEEQNFVRKVLNKRDRKKLDARDKGYHDELAELEQFTDLAHVDELIKERDAASASGKRVTLMQYIADEDDDETMREVSKHLGEEEAAMGKKKDKKASKKRQRQDDEDADGFEDSEELVEKPKSKKKKTAADRILEDEALFEGRGEDGKAHASKDIVDNRGLSRYKNKARGKNPKKLLRTKYTEKTGDIRKQKNIASQKGSSSFGATSVNTNVVSSRKI